ncbi:HAMP domain-containing sensor histidine kinase [Streptomyces coacervatus]|uniref:Signal transduction histidine-protein kinase/phosphatase MprB n=1 Tax=Streptomyces coacervatus TaxID=647381 RepID=A0ABP7JBW3_9ACTN|nr:HAMP domain-containing sensor histidine kinase [Streptomyces coacervatus]MDF2271863.1 HAMP domain-containing sensor histidine kinase [Streptomyces coacervatus]
MLRDTFLIALYAAIGAGAAGVLGVGALRLLRNRSVALSLAMVATVAVAAMLAGTMLVSWAMLLSDHDLWVVTMVCSIAAVVSLAVALVLGRNVVKGSQALAEATRALGDEGRFTPPRTAPTAELAQLVRELDSTSAKLAASRERERALEESRRELVAWISHALRTPLARLQAMTEALEDDMVDDMVDDPSVYHARIRGEVGRLSEMVGDLFELSRIQAGVLALNTARMSVYDVVGDAIAGTAALAREHGVRIVGDGVEPVPIEVDGREMSRVLANLLVNAIPRTPSDGTVAVSARQEADSVVVSVTDSCGGIRPEDLPRVFDTGWRGTDARTPPAGAGLGLAIVRGIIEAHRGQAAVHNVPGGCRFEVRLPTAA